MLSGDGPHQGGLSACRILRLELRTGGHKRLDRSGGAGARRRHERCFTAPVRAIRRRARGQEQRGHLGIPVDTGD